MQALRLLAFASVLAILAGCSGGRGNPASTLTVLAGSEIKDLEPILADLEKDTGVHLDITYTGTLAGIDRIASGDNVPDVAWFSQAK